VELIVSLASLEKREAFKGGTCHKLFLSFSLVTRKVLHSQLYSFLVFLLFIDTISVTEIIVYDPEWTAKKNLEGCLIHYDGILEAISAVNLSSFIHTLVAIWSDDIRTRNTNANQFVRLVVVVKRIGKISFMSKQHALWHNTEWWDKAATITVLRIRSEWHCSQFWHFIFIRQSAMRPTQSGYSLPEIKLRLSSLTWVTLTLSPGRLQSSSAPYAQPYKTLLIVAPCILKIHSIAFYSYILASVDKTSHSYRVPVSTSVTSSPTYFQKLSAK
jgi:hypothetical protein